MASTTEGAEIRYTTDGTNPTSESAKYTSPIQISAVSTFKAIAFKTGMEKSPVSTPVVSIKEKKVTEIKIETAEVDKKLDDTATVKVTNLSATAKDGKVLLTWTDNTSDEDVFGYEVCYSGEEAINRVAFPTR